MALVDYTSSDEDDGRELQPAPGLDTATLKRKRDENPSDLPPLPSKFHDLYASTTRLSTRDDPSLHGGRKRVIPHVEGNWPTHVYIEWYPSTAENESLASLISQLNASLSPEKDPLNSFLTSDLGAPLPLHISLSRPIAFPTETKDAFIRSLEGSVRSSGIRPFNVTIFSLDWAPNFEKTRWFLVLRLEKPQLNGLNKLLYVSNRVVAEYGQSTLYTTLPQIVKTLKPRRQGNHSERRASEAKMDWSNLQEVSDAFHVSIAWTLEAPGPELLETTTSLLVDGFQHVKKMSFKVEEIKAKVGNIVTNIPLPTNFIVGKAIWGD